MVDSRHFFPEKDDLPDEVVEGSVPMEDLDRLLEGESPDIARDSPAGGSGEGLLELGELLRGVPDFDGRVFAFNEVLHRAGL